MGTRLVDSIALLLNDFQRLVTSSKDQPDPELYLHTAVLYLIGSFSKWLPKDAAPTSGQIVWMTNPLDDTVPAANVLDVEIDRFVKSGGGVLPKSLNSAYVKSKLMACGFQRKHADTKGHPAKWIPNDGAPLIGACRKKAYDLVKNDPDLRSGKSVDLYEFAKKHGLDGPKEFDNFRTSLWSLHSHHGLLRYDSITHKLSLP